MRILVINSGSSSIKYAVYKMPEETREANGNLSGAGQTSSLDELENRLGSGCSPEIIGHRLVHGGPRYTVPERVTAELLRDLKGLIPLAPNHLPRQIDA